jgi:hypothetical protein
VSTPQTALHDLAAIQELLEPLFPGLMGVRLVTVAQDRVVAEMSVRPQLCTSGGILHGGAYMAFADTLGAVGTIVNLAEGKRTATTVRAPSSSPLPVSTRRSPGSPSPCIEAEPRWSGKRRSATPKASSAPS